MFLKASDIRIRPTSELCDTSDGSLVLFMGKEGFLILIQSPSTRAIMITVEQRQEIIKDYQTGDKDTGSPEVQVALLTARINNLTEHFKTHKKDKHSRRGLIKLINQRRKLLAYAKRKDNGSYQDLIKRLGLRR